MAIDIIEFDIFNYIITLCIMYILRGKVGNHYAVR